MPAIQYLPLIICLVASELSFADQAADTGAVQKGMAIAVEADRLDSGYVDSEESFTMVLRDSKGRERLRTMRMRTFERSDDGDWSLTIFDEPADVRGTALLTYSHGLDPDDQWIYLPAMKRVKRISSKNRSGPFMGSELAFEDMSAFELEKYSYRYLRDEACDELQCFVSEWVPLYEHSGYSRMEVWHDQEAHRLQRVDFFDRKDRHVKTLRLDDYKLYDERFWRARHWEMSNHKNGKTTLLNYNNIELGIGLSERDFDQTSLKNAR
jgi:outer membrane lipoprotein-sorting protein